MFLDTEAMAHARLNNQDLESDVTEVTTSSSRWPLKVASVFLLTALGLVLFLPQVSQPRSSSMEGVISKSETMGGLSIEGVDSKKSQAAVQSMQKGFASLGNMFGFGKNKGHLDSKDSLEAAKKSLKKAETSMMSVFQDLQKKQSKMNPALKNVGTNMENAMRTGHPQLSGNMKDSLAKSQSSLRDSLAKLQQIGSHWKPLQKVQGKNGQPVNPFAVQGQTGQPTNPFAVQGQTGQPMNPFAAFQSGQAS